MDSVRELLSRLFAIYSTAVRYTQKARARKFRGRRNRVKMGKIGWKSTGCVMCCDLYPPLRELLIRFSRKSTILDEFHCYVQFYLSYIAWNNDVHS